MVIRRLTQAAYEYLVRFPFNFNLVNKMLKKGEEERELVASYSELHRRHEMLVNNYCGLMQEAARLEAENNFMLKLINERDRNESN